MYWWRKQEQQPNVVSSETLFGKFHKFKQNAFINVYLCFIFNVYDNCAYNVYIVLTTDLRTYGTFFIVSSAKYRGGGHTAYSNSEDSEQPTYFMQFDQILNDSLGSKESIKLKAKTLNFVSSHI